MEGNSNSSKSKFTQQSKAGHVKYLLTAAMMLVTITASLSSCGKHFEEGIVSEKTNHNGENTENTPGTQMKITIGTSVFTATLNNNATGDAFKARLPLTLNLTELNGNEKYFDLPTALPSNATNPQTIQAGDLLLYGSKTLVLFYKTFSTSYSYTSIARLDNPSGLAAALGSGNVAVKFELE